MRALSRSAVVAWCEERGLGVAGNRLVYADGERRSVVVPFETLPASRIVQLGDYLVPTWRDMPQNGGLVWIQERGVWGEFFENTGEAVLSYMRRGAGVREPTSELPGYTFERSEMNEFHAYFTLPRIFGWEAFAVPESSDYFVYISHDGIAVVVSRTASAHDAATQRLHSWNAREGGSYYWDTVPR